MAQAGMLAPSGVDMVEQFFLGVALIGCLGLVYRLLRPPQVSSCHNAQCGCEEEAEKLGALVQRQEKEP